MLTQIFVEQRFELIGDIILTSSPVDVYREIANYMDIRLSTKIMMTIQRRLIKC